MKNNTLKRRCVAAVFSVMIMFMAGLWVSFAAPAPEKKNPKNVSSVKKEESQPIVATPEKTVEAFLNAIIAKDIHAAMAYVPKSDSQSGKKWRDEVEANIREHMTTKKHIIAIVGIQLEKVEDQTTKGKLAYVLSKIETTPEYFGPGIVITDSDGKNRSLYKWKFRQLNDQGPWLYEEGFF